MREHLRRLVLSGTLAATLILSGCAATDSVGITEESALEEGDPSEVPLAPGPEVTAPPEVSPAFDTPWPLEVTRRELADTALAKTYAFIEQRTPGAHEGLLTVVSQDTVVEFHRAIGTDLAELTADTFADYLDEGAFLALGTNIDFLIESLEERGRPFNPQAIPSTGTVCVAYLGTAWISWPSFFGREELPRDKNLTACVPHELFHIAQDTLDPWPASQTYPPGHELYRAFWLTEGSAQFIGHALVSYQGYHDYWGNHFTLGAGDLGQDRPRLRGYESYESGFAGYQWGQLATEYIIASVGVEPLMDIWKYAGEGASFEDAFEQAIGLSVEEFYKAFDIMNEEMIQD